MMEEYSEAERRADYRAYFAGIAPRLEKPPKPSEAFPSLAGLDSDNRRLRREDWPDHWKIHYGSDTEVVRQIQEAFAASNLRRMAKNPVIQ